jgi:release factor glutamine methyltransferase
MLLTKLINLYVKKLNAVGINNSLEEIRLMIQEILKIDLATQLLKKDLIINERQKKLIKECLNKRLKREPFDRILKKKIFRDFELDIKSHTFSPRKETELLIDIIIDMKLNPKYILELGTGSGAISIALMKSFPEAKSIATDINHSSLKLAKQNAKKNHVLGQINFICCNWLDIFVSFDFDIILANPPYIKTEVIKKLEPEVRCYDPIISLDGGKNGVDCYKKIISGLDQKLYSKNSKILFEIGYDQAQKVKKLMKEANIMKTRVFKDYSNQPRFVIGEITKSTI